jgi:hypothetical protein
MKIELIEKTLFQILLTSKFKKQKFRNSIKKISKFRVINTRKIKNQRKINYKFWEILNFLIFSFFNKNLLFDIFFFFSNDNFFKSTILIKKNMLFFSFKRFLKKDKLLNIELPYFENVCEISFVDFLIIFLIKYIEKLLGSFLTISLILKNHINNIYWNSNETLFFFSEKTKREFFKFLKIFKILFNNIFFSTKDFLFFCLNLNYFFNYKFFLREKIRNQFFVVYNEFEKKISIFFKKKKYLKFKKLDCIQKTFYKKNYKIGLPNITYFHDMFLKFFCKIFLNFFFLGKNKKFFFPKDKLKLNYRYKKLTWDYHFELQKLFCRIYFKFEFLKKENFFFFSQITEKNLILFLIYQLENCLLLYFENFSKNHRNFKIFLNFLIKIDFFSFNIGNVRGIFKVLKNSFVIFNFINLQKKNNIERIQIYITENPINIKNFFLNYVFKGFLYFYF